MLFNRVDVVDLENLDITATLTSIRHGLFTSMPSATS